MNDKVMVMTEDFIQLRGVFENDAMELAQAIAKLQTALFTMGSAGYSNITCSPDEFCIVVRACREETDMEQAKRLSEVKDSTIVALNKKIEEHLDRVAIMKDQRDRLMEKANAKNNTGSGDEHQEQREGSDGEES